LPDLRSHFPPLKDSRRTSFRLRHPNKTPDVAQNNNENRLYWLKPPHTTPPLAWSGAQPACPQPENIRPP
jgi:hypothetical protein